MSTVILALILVVVAATLVWAELRPQRAERTYGALEGGRKLAAGAFLVIFSITAIQSGRWYLIAAALLAIAVATLYFAVERPHENARRRLT